jgi:hypothetical protein
MEDCALLINLERLGGYIPTGDDDVLSQEPRTPAGKAAPRSNVESDVKHEGESGDEGVAFLSDGESHAGGSALPEGCDSTNGEEPCSKR